MAEGNHDGEERFEEDIVEVVYEDDLECSSAIGEDGSGGIRDFEVFGYGVDVCEDDGAVACAAQGVDDGGKRVDWTTLARDGCWWGVDGAEGVFDVVEVDPDGMVGEAFVV